MTSTSIHMKLKFDLYSDTHTEYIDEDTFDGWLVKNIVKNNDLLVLAGDIGCLHSPNFPKLIDYVAEKWEKVIFVPGNHEFYSTFCDIDSLKKKYADFMLSYPNVHYLDNSSYEYKGYLFVGSVLWSNPTITKARSDFWLIQEKESNGNIKGLTRDKYNVLYKEALAYVKNTVDNASNKVILITHFPPISKGVCDPEFENSIYNDYFTNKLNDLDVSLKNVKMWISGHTHYSYDIDKDGCKFVSNQLGYKWETNKKFHSTFSVN